MNKRKRKGIIQVYTDGCYDLNRNIGGYGAVIFMVHKGENKMRRLSSTSSYIDTTHNRMEIRAVLACLSRIKVGYDIDIYSDSTYCVNTFKKVYSSRFKPLANEDLWGKIRKLIINHKNGGSHINISWVRGHSGNTFNEIADRLAFKGCNQPGKRICDKNFVENQSKRRKKKNFIS